MLLARQQIADIGTHFRHAEQAGLVIHHSLELNCCHVLRLREVIDQARIQITAARAHHQSRRWCKSHTRINACAIAHGGQAGAIAKMSENHPAACCCLVTQTRQFFQQVLKG